MYGGSYYAGGGYGQIPTSEQEPVVQDTRSFSAPIDSFSTAVALDSTLEVGAAQEIDTAVVSDSVNESIYMDDIAGETAYTEDEIYYIND